MSWYECEMSSNRDGVFIGWGGNLIFLDFFWIFEALMIKKHLVFLI
jgi:hypothetical protein